MTYVNIGKPSERNMGMLYYFCIFSVSLKLFINEKLFLKNLRKRTAHPLEPVCLDLNSGSLLVSCMTFIEQVILLCIDFLILKTGVIILFNSLNVYED